MSYRLDIYQRCHGSLYFMSKQTLDERTHQTPHFIEPVLQRLRLPTHFEPRLMV